MYFLNIGFSWVIILIPILIAIAFFTLLERKFIGYSHLRKGPNKAALIGLLIPIADAIKLFTKQITLGFNFNFFIYFFSPILILFLALVIWFLYPFNSNPIKFSLGIIFFLIVSSIGVYPSLLRGWRSNSKYSLIGALRNRAQTVSYEVSIALVLLAPIIILKTYNFNLLVYSNIFILILLLPFLLWFITCLAETNRTPFDLAEGESELVSGFNTEYSSGRFAFIFIAEYINILFVSLLTSILFLNLCITWISAFIRMGLILQTLFMSVVFIWVRVTLPRIRYDQLINFAWKGILPLILGVDLLIFFISYFLFISF